MQPFEGIKVVDLAQVAAAPMAARFLGDFGADVIHIEHPTRGDLLRVLQQHFKNGSPEFDIDYDFLWENYNRNKRGMAVDLSQEDGRGIIFKLVEKADIFLSNLRPFELERFGLRYEELCAVNPRIIYGNLTGFGRKGALKDVPAFDSTAHWGRSGIAYRLTRFWEPPMPGVGGFGDNVAALALYGGVTTALYARERTGIGQEIDVSLLHTGVYQLSFELSAALATGHDAVAAGRQAIKDRGFDPSSDSIDELREMAPNPLGIPHKTKDDRWFMLSLVNPDRYWVKLCQAIEREDVADDPRFTTAEARGENHTALYHILADAFRSKTLDEWRSRMEGIPSAPMQTFKEAVDDPQARENGVFTSFDHPTHGRVEAIANPLLLSKTPATVSAPAPTLGEHTDEILKEYGYTPEDIERLRRLEVVA